MEVREIAVGADFGLLGGDHRLVLVSEGGGDNPAQFGVEIGFAEPVGAGHRPEIMGGRRGFRGKQMEEGRGDAVRDRGADIGDADIEKHGGGRMPAHVGARIAAGRRRGPEHAQEAAGFAVRLPALRQHDIALAQQFGARGIQHVRRGEGGVEELDVAEVEQVVGDQLVVGGDAQVAGDGGVAHGLAERGEVGDGGGVGAGGLAEPEPDETVALGERIGANPGGRWDRAAVRIVHAGASAVEAQAMVAALQRVIDQLAAGQRRHAVRAAVGQRDWLTGWQTDHYHWLVQQNTAERRRPKLGSVGGDIPGVAEVAGQDSILAFSILI